MYGPVEIRPTSILLHNYTLGENYLLEKQYVYMEKVYGKYKPVFMGIKYDPENRTLFVPGGTNMYYIIPQFSNIQTIRVFPDEFQRLEKIRLKYPPRDERQKQAIRFCLGLQEYQMNRDKTQISVNLDTGVGKTYVAIFIFAYYEIKTIMITSVYNWLDQWKERILQYTDIKEDEIYTIAGSSSIQKLFNGMKDHNKIKFYLATHDTINNYAKTNGWNSVGELFKQLQIGIKIYDEAHLNFDNICKIDFNTNTWKTFYLTATPMKSKKEENIIYQHAFKTVPKISLFDEENDPHTSYLAIIFNSHPKPFDIQECMSMNYGFSPIKYIDYFINTDSFYKMLKLVLHRSLLELRENEKILIYIGKNEGIMRAYYWIKYNYSNYSVGIFTTLTGKEEKYNELNNQIILTTAKSSSACLDIPGLKKSIVFAEPFSSEVYAKQILGRTRDHNTEMIELVDVGFKRIKEWYFKKRRNIYDKYAIECNEVAFNEFELSQALIDISRYEKSKLEEKMNSGNMIQVVDIVKNK